VDLHEAVNGVSSIICWLFTMKVWSLTVRLSQLSLPAPYLMLGR
jgi:hypothetical protein